MTQKKTYKSKHLGSAWSGFDYGKKKNAMLQICLYNHYQSYGL